MAWLEDFWFGCGGCDGQHHCRLVEQMPADTDGSRLLSGSTLVVSCLLVFVLPMVTTIAGACAAGRFRPEHGTLPLGCWQTAGALAGLLAGVGFARLVLWCMGRRANACPPRRST